MPLSVALAATLHDPDAALLRDVQRALPVLRAHYAHLAIATSPPTSPRMVALLEAEGVWGGVPRANLRGPLYRLALRRAVAADVERVHYLDFDRAIHWAAEKPRELAAVVRLSARHAVLLVGRSPKAHASHQRPLWATELVANRVLADRLGLRGRLDFLVPSFVLTRAAARTLASRSRSRDTAIYGELVALLGAIAPALAYVECRGLDWETPDRFRAVVRRVGLAAWRARWDTPAEWALRTDMAEAFVRGFDRAAARVPAIVRTVTRAKLAC